MLRLANFFLGLLAPTPAISLVQATGKIEWKGPNSAKNQSAPMIRGTLEVPLDYTYQTSNKTLTFQLPKIPAVKKPRRNSVLLNFGGPGEDSTVYMAAFGAEIQAQVGNGRWQDIILMYLVVSLVALSTSSPLTLGTSPGSRQIQNQTDRLLVASAGIYRPPCYRTLAEIVIASMEDPSFGNASDTVLGWLWAAVTKTEWVE
jgi:hypothetical protein